MSSALLLAGFWQSLVGILMFLTALFLILLVLVQRGRGGGLAGATPKVGSASHPRQPVISTTESVVRASCAITTVATTRARMTRAGRWRRLTWPAPGSRWGRCSSTYHVLPGIASCVERIQQSSMI